MKQLEDKLLRRPSDPPTCLSQFTTRTALCAATGHWLWRCRQVCCCSGRAAQLSWHWHWHWHWHTGKNIGLGTGNTEFLSSCRCYAAPQGRISAGCRLLPLLAVTINCLQAASCRWLLGAGLAGWPGLAGVPTGGRRGQRRGGRRRHAQRRTPRPCREGGHVEIRQAGGGSGRCRVACSLRSTRHSHLARAEPHVQDAAGLQQHCKAQRWAQASPVVVAAAVAAAALVIAAAVAAGSGATGGVASAAAIAASAAAVAGAAVIVACITQGNTAKCTGGA